MYKIAIVLRYLRKRKITIFPIAGVALGVMALVVVLSIMEGFETDFRRHIRGVSPDLSLDSTSVYGFSFRTDELLRRIEGVEEVRAVSPYISGPALAYVEIPDPDNPLIGQVSSAFVMFKGFDFHREQEVVNLKDYLKDGRDFFAEHPYRSDGSTSPAFILGSRFAGKRNPDERSKSTDWGKIDVGAAVKIATWTVESEPHRQKGPVGDIFSSGIYDIDKQTLFMPLDWARQLRRMSAGSVSGVGIALREYNDRTVAAAKVHIRAAIADLTPPGGYELKTWEESHGIFLIAIAMERRIMAFILFFFLVVAGFSVAAILIMIVLEKVRDIGILRAIGASSRGIAAVFLLYGVTIGLIGAAIGLGLGVVFVKNIDAIESAVYDLTGWQPFPPEIYDLPAIPRILNWWTNLIIVAVALAVSFLAAVLPAFKASWLDPVEAIRYE